LWSNDIRVVESAFDRLHTLCLVPAASDDTMQQQTPPTIKSFGIIPTNAGNSVPFKKVRQAILKNKTTAVQWLKNLNWDRCRRMLVESLQKTIMVSKRILQSAGAHSNSTGSDTNSAEVIVYRSNSETLYRAGGVSVIIGAMRKWFDNPRVQAKGCRALIDISYPNRWFIDTFPSTGAFETVIWAMEYHANDRDVQYYGLGVLLLLMTSGEAAGQIVKAGGIDRIVAAATSFEHDAKLQKLVCWALHDLTEYDAYVEIIFESGGMRVLMAAIENHLHVEKDEHTRELRNFAVGVVKNRLTPLLK